MIESFLNSEHVVLVGSIILLVAILAAKSGTRFGTPILLLFLLVGMAFGSDGLGIKFNSPMAAQFIGILALSVILFTGGMDTRYGEIRPVAAEGIVLATLGVFLTALLTGAFIWVVSDFFGVGLSPVEAMLLASVMSSTDSASVFSILRSKKQGLKQNLRPLLELESGSNDPMAYILTIILVQAAQPGDNGSVWSYVSMFLIQMVVGAAAGYLFGRLTVYVMNRINLRNKSLYSVLLLAIVYFIFSMTDLIGGNGYLAVYLAGLVVGNYKIVYQKSLATFFDGYTWLFQIVMFITLGLLVNPHEMLGVWHMGLLVAVFMIVVARPAAVFLCLSPFRKITAKGKLYVSWVGLRGAVPIIFATYPWVAGLEHAGVIFNTVFFITILSLLVQGTTVSSMANVLGLSTTLKEDSFGIDMPDEIKADLTEMEVRPEWLAHGSLMRDLRLDKHTLVMMIRRGDDYIVPKGDTELQVGDKMLCVTGESDRLPEDHAVAQTAGWREKTRRAFAGLFGRERAIADSAARLGEGDPGQCVGEEGPDFDIGTEDVPQGGSRFGAELMDDGDRKK